MPETNYQRLWNPAVTVSFSPKGHRVIPTHPMENSNEIVIYLKEKNEAPGGYSDPKAESKGFHDPVAVRDFTIRGKNLFPNIRCRWIVKDGALRKP